MKETPQALCEKTFALIQEPSEHDSIQSLRHCLDARSRQLENLSRNIPGGAHQCANDSNLTLLSMSDSFLSMFGYTKEEIETQFDGKFVNMIYPGDRAGVIKATYAQLENGSDIELEYRVLQKNGQPIWVLDKGRLMDDGNGGQCFYCLLLNNTQRKQQQEDLRLSLERHQVIMDQATDIIFEWDILKDTLHFSPNWKKRFGYEAIDTQISGRIPLSENIHPEDMAAFVKIMRDTAAGVAYSETEFRIRNLVGSYYWCRIRATTQYNSDGRPIKAIGVIADIDEEKKQKEKLILQAQYDALTGIYNKSTINALVEQKMHGQSSSCSCTLSNRTPLHHALLIIDVDHFKAVNDNYGHLCGDSVLSDVAALLKGCTRSSDLVGRIGGDEFLVYLPEVADEASVRLKAQQLLDELGDYIKNLDDHGIFYCHQIETLHPDVYAVLKPQGIRSMLQCAMLDEGEFTGYVGFAECREHKAWSDRQVASFKLTANVLSTFVIKLRLKKRDTVLTANQQTDGGNTNEKK